jgi:nitrite reductase/ring-hydroxylating ferredoxin subunit
VVNDNCHLTENLTMITHEENELLTQTGKGTPCGELMRRYWQPAGLSEELAADKPLPVQMFGEELVLFRDGDGKPALIGRYCAHQGVDMIYGRVEPDGLRCMYHGWLFDNCGKVVLRGEWLPEKERRWDVGQPAYPCIEAVGIIFAYMGPGEPPVLPLRQLGAEPMTSYPVKRLERKANYFHGIVNVDEQLPHRDRFFIPNLVVSRGESAAEENRLRWHVPVDDQTHFEYTLCYLGPFPSTSSAQTSAPEELRIALAIILGERATASAAPGKT